MTGRHLAVLATILALVASACAGAAPTDPTDPTDLTDPTDPADPTGSVARSPEAETAPTARPTPEPTPQPTHPPRPGSWTLVWGDSFDQPAGTVPDPAVWGYALGDGTTSGIVGWGNNERQWYTDDPIHASTDGDGHLVITATVADGARTCYYGPCEYESARLLTRDRFAIQYGRIEIVAQVPAGFGVWPAFWMLGTNLDAVGWPQAGEVDILEYVGRWPNDIFGSIHGPGYSGASAYTKTVTLDRPVAEDAHEFAIEWAPGSIVWYLDGERYHEALPSDVTPNEWVFDQPFYLLLNLAVGGNLAGPVFPDTVFPARLVVDHIRVYEAGP